MGSLDSVGARDLLFRLVVDRSVWTLQPDSVAAPRPFSGCIGLRPVHPLASWIWRPPPGYILPTRFPASWLDNVAPGDGEARRVAWRQIHLRHQGEGCHRWQAYPAAGCAGLGIPGNRRDFSRFCGHGPALFQRSRIRFRKLGPAVSFRSVKATFRPGPIA